MVKFSIITCTFNASDVIERTLESVFRQSYRNVEHIIIDGCSRDDTMEKVMRQEAKVREMDDGLDSQKAAADGKAAYSMVVVSEPDRGLYDAMNKGIARAKGDYLVFLNAGDKFYCEDTLLLLAEKIEEAVAKDGGKMPGVVYGDTDIVDDEGRFLHKRRLSPPERLTWRSFQDGMLVCHQSFYARTDIAKCCPYDLTYRLSADVDWCIRVMKKAEEEGLPLLNTHQTLTAYLDGGMSVKNHRASLIERFNIMRRHYGLFTTIKQHVWFALGRYSI